MKMNLIDNISLAANNPLGFLLTAKDNKTRKQHGDALRVLVQNSKQFLVDEEVTKTAARIGIEQPEILIQLLRRARLPFENIYVEWFNRVACTSGGEEAHPDAPEKIGCFIQTIQSDKPLYRMTIVGGIGNGFGASKILISPLSYVFRTDEKPSPNKKEIEFIKNVTSYDESFLNKANVGTAYVTANLKNMVDAVQLLPYGHHSKVPDHFYAGITKVNVCEEFMEHCTTCLTPITKQEVISTYDIEPKVIKEYLRSDVVESAGTYRFIVSLLALINTREYITQTKSSRPQQKKLIAGKIVPYIEHITVSLKVPREIVEQYVRDSFGTSDKRQHDVMGSWRSYKNDGNRKCDHAYVYEENSTTRQRCVHCKKLKWYTGGYKRGNPQLGIIVKTHKLELV
jgi:hypothetical protein